MLNRIVDEIDQSIKNECFIAALSLALMLPDICGKAEYPKASDTQRYIQWYNTYIGQYEKPSHPYGDDMPYTSGELVYNLRNSMLHQGTPSVDSSRIKEERCKIDRFVLAISSVYDSGYSVLSLKTDTNDSYRELNISLLDLCNKICKAAKKYYSENESKFTFLQYELIDKREAYEQIYGKDESEIG